ncbi:uncharacterized protein [Macrobrachium rosenbergii]|uniref:uncharacterized protein n=1 Tax=Macrobrachium rosenbergii TaxID=79674 RepID=UPI0034D721E1
MVEASASACAEAVLSSWISRFGVPDDITTDRGPAFLSELWVSLAHLMGTTLHSMAAYNPAANSMVERTHHSLKATLMACCTDENWKAQLPWVLLGLRIAPKANGEESPAEKVYGEALAVPGEFFPMELDDLDTPLPRLREIAKKFTPCWKTFVDRTHNFSPEGLKTCAYVFMKNGAHRAPLTRPYRGPYRVISRTSKAYLVNIHGQEDWISIDRLKPAFLMDSGTWEETGRCPRIPPQEKTLDEEIGFPKRG